MEVAVLLAPLVVAAGMAGASIRRVPAGERGVVLRHGRPVRTQPPGLTFVLPVAERLESVPLSPAPINPLHVVARSRDGVEVRLAINVLWRVVDPTLTVQSSPPARCVTADAVERALHHLIAKIDLVTLLRDREPMLTEITDATRPRLVPIGVELVDVNLLDAEVRVGSELLRLLA
jgi:regulator of protease activity HflC (stomatin/prohibitin superfamily)